MMSTTTPCIGFLGGGQLARMSAMAAYRLGFRVAVFEREHGSPAGQLTHLEFVGSPAHRSLLRRFASRCSVVTLENEFIDPGYLEVIERTGTRVVPGSPVLHRIQDKLLQKAALARQGIPVPRFSGLDGSGRSATAHRFAYPLVLKSRKMGYDGYGNATVRTEAEFIDAITLLERRHAQLMVEEHVDFRMELAVMVARTSKETAVYPVVETIQRNHICHTVIAPARISAATAKRAKEIAVAAVEAVRGYGLFGVELFLAGNGRLLVNEMAPRPHNSGHYTIEGCVTSQFENHVRAVLRLPLGSTAMVRPAAVMVNLLGKPLAGRSTVAALQAKDIHLHIYGKTKSRPGRKMGHITLLGEDAGRLLRRAHRIEPQLFL